MLGRLESLRVAWKFEWESRLRKERCVSALGHPDTLVFKMDETISELVQRLRRDRAFRPHPKALMLPLDRHCTCRLNPLSKFFATGEESLRVVARDFPPEAVHDALVRLRWQGLDEIENLCGVCQNRLKAGHPAEGAGRDWTERCAAYRG